MTDPEDEGTAPATDTGALPEFDALSDKEALKNAGNPHGLDLTAHLKGLVNYGENMKEAAKQFQAETGKYLAVDPTVPGIGASNAGGKTGMAAILGTVVGDSRFGEMADFVGADGVMGDITDLTEFTTDMANGLALYGDVTMKAHAAYTTADAAAHNDFVKLGSTMDGKLEDSIIGMDRPTTPPSGQTKAAV